MTTGLRFGGLALAAISITLGGCAAPAIGDGAIASSLERDKETDGETTTGGGSEGAPSSRPPARAEDAPAPAATTAAPAAAAPPQINVSFLGSLNQTFGGQVIGRACSDRGADLQNATFLDGTSFEIVSVDYPDKILATVSGAPLETMKQQMVANGSFVVPVDPSKLPTSPYEFAIIMGGDDRFGSPAGCGVSLKPTSATERDARNFPNNNLMIFGGKFGGTGCGTVGYIQAYYDQAQQKVVAVASSQFLLAAWDGSSGFPAMQDRTPCDVNHSPLVLDLGERGVTLSAPVADLFDIDGDGKRDAIPWVVSDETPFLVRDANDNGTVDGVDELFGNRTRGPAGTRGSQNGFEALAAWDDTADGAISARDEVWSSLRLWFDRNHDGRTDPGELESLESRGVRSIALSFVSVKENLCASGLVQGAVRQRGGATMTDGRVANVVDVWFDPHF